jgi:hypothetical protein
VNYAIVKGEEVLRYGACRRQESLDAKRAALGEGERLVLCGPGVRDSTHWFDGAQLRERTPLAVPATIDIAPGTPIAFDVPEGTVVRIRDEDGVEEVVVDDTGLEVDFLEPGRAVIEFTHPRRIDAATKVTIA